MPYDPNIHHRRSIRLQGYDYSQAGAYFITICTHKHKCLFGEITNGEMQLNDAGLIVQYIWNDLINHIFGIVLDKFIVMPNHIHGIIMISVGAGSKPAQTKNPMGAGLEPAPTKGYGLPEIVRQFKTFSARRINASNKTHGITFWQRNYYEHIIRDDDDYERIAEYIINNPLQWESDENNPANIKNGINKYNP